MHAAASLQVNADSLLTLARELLLQFDYQDNAGNTVLHHKFPQVGFESPSTFRRNPSPEAERYCGSAVISLSFSLSLSTALLSLSLSPLLSSLSLLADSIISYACVA